MVGIPASGKSTYLDQYRDNHIVISRDEIRYSMMKEGDRYFDNEKKVYKEYIRQIQEALDTSPDYVDVYADATHLNFMSRHKLLSRLKLNDISVNCIFINISLDKAIERNKNREGLERTPEEVIKQFYNMLVPPTLEEYSYKTIITINNDL